MRQKITLLMVIAITSLLLTLHFATAQNRGEPEKDLKPTLILVSIDGLHRTIWTSIRLQL
jgi:hypothetical protein